MKFNWKANWEILLVLVIIVVGIVITTIAAIRNKDKHLLPLAEETDFGQLLAGGGLSDTTLPPQQPPADGQLPGAEPEEATAGEQVARRPPGSQQSKSWRPSTFQPPALVGLRAQQATLNQRSLGKQQQQQQQQEAQSKYDESLSSELTRAVDQLLLQQQQQGQDSYADTMNSTEPSPTLGLQQDPNQQQQLQLQLQASFRARGQRPYASRSSNNNRTSAIELEGGSGGADGAGRVGPAHSPYGERLGGESADLTNDDIHTTRSALAPANNSANYFAANSNLVQPAGAQLEQLSVLANLQGAYGQQQQQQQQQQQVASMNQLGRLLMQHDAHSNKLEPLAAATGPMVLETDDMMTSYTRAPAITNGSLADATLLLRDYNFALGAANQSAQNEEPALLNSFGQQPEPAAPNQRTRAHLSSAPISVFLNDLLKFARLQPADQSSSAAPAGQQQQQRSLLKLLPGPLLASIQAAAAAGEQVPPQLAPNHVASESNQHYQRVSVMPGEAHAVLARSLRNSAVLPAFPAPKDAPQVWPASAAEAHGADADFVASNAAGFVRSVGVSNPNEHLAAFSQQTHPHPQQQQQHQQGFMRQASSVAAREFPAAYQQQQQQQQQPFQYQRSHSSGPYGQPDSAPVDQHEPPRLQQQSGAVHPRALQPASGGPMFGQQSKANSQQLAHSNHHHHNYNNNNQHHHQQHQQQQLDYQSNSNYNNHKKFSAAHDNSMGQQHFAAAASSVSSVREPADQANGANSRQQAAPNRHAQSEESRPSERVLVPLGYNPPAAQMQAQPQVAQQAPNSVAHNALERQQQQPRAVSSESFGEMARESRLSATSVAAPIPLGQVASAIASSNLANRPQQSQQPQQLSPLLRQQQLGNSLPSRKRRSLMGADAKEEAGRVDEVMSGKYDAARPGELEGAGEADEEEEDGDARPISVVRPDGRPTDSGRVRASQTGERDDRQTAQSQRSANHFQMKQLPAPPRYLSTLVYDRQDPSQDGAVDENGRQDERLASGNDLLHDPRELRAQAHDVEQQSAGGPPRRHLPGRKGLAPDSAASGLMSRLLGTASTNDEFEEDPEEVDGDDSANEKRKEELEDAEFGLASPQREERRNGGGGGDRARGRAAAISRGSLGRQSGELKLRQPAANSAGVSGPANGEVGSHSRRHQQRADIEFYGHPGEETRQLKYGILGSGNYEVVNGGVYPDTDESAAAAAVNSVANYVRKPSLLGKLFAANHHQAAAAAAVGPQAALIAAGGRINGGFLRGASGAIGHDGANELGGGGGYVPASELAKDLSGPLLELIDVNGGGQLLDASLLAQLGSSGSSAQTTHASKEEEREGEEGAGGRSSKRPILSYGGQRSKLISSSKLLAAKRLVESRDQTKRRKKAKAGAEQQEETGDGGTRGARNGDESRMKFSSSNRMPTNSAFTSSGANENEHEHENGEATGEPNASQLLQRQQTSISGSRLSHGTNQFNSYKLLPSKKVTIYSDQDLDSAPSEQLPLVR